MKYYTIKNLADRLQVSKTAIRKHMSDSFRAEHTRTVNGVIEISETGCELIANRLRKPTETQRKPIAETSENTPQTDHKPIAETENHATEAIIEMLRRELDSKNAQIEKLQQLLDQEQQLHLRAQQQLHLLTAPEQEPADDEIVIDESEPEKKKGFFSRLFKK